MTKITEQNYDLYRDAVVTAVWEVWTKSGLNQDEFTREQTGKSASDAVTNAYTDGIDIADWQSAALRLLSGNQKVAVLDDNTRDANVIGEAETEEQAADVFMAYMRDRMDAQDFADLKRPAFAYRVSTSVISPAFEPLF